MWAGYCSFGDPTGRASGFSEAVSLLFTKRGTRTTRVVKKTGCLFIPSQNVVIVQDRRMRTRFRSHYEKGKLPLDKDSKKDLERHRPIDVLPDREAATVTAWLKAHPQINI